MSSPIRCDSRRDHSDDLPSSKPGAAPVPKGRALELGADATYDISDRVAGEEQPQLEVLPITMYVTEYAERQFCQIAVNARYICYGLRAGQVRVLHKDTASRALLRGHTAQIADMRFSPATNADILASFGVDGNLFVKKIVSPAGGDGDIEEKALLHVTVTTDVAASGVPLTPRVRWLSKTQIVASYGDGVFVVDVDPKAREAKTVTLDLAAGADAPAGVKTVSPMANKPAVTDLAVAPGANGRLAVAHADGSVRVWSPVENSGFAQDSAFTPFDDAPDAPLASVHFASEDALVVGGENNGALAMWSLPPPNDDMTSSPEHVHTLTFAPSGDIFNVVNSAAPGARLVLVSNLKKQAVYAVHYAETASRGFDYVAEFSTTMPVLSFAATREAADDAADAAGPGGALQLYCMQTQAIQQYALAVDRCRPEACVDDEAAEADASEEEESESEAEEEEAPPAAAPATPPAAAPKAAKQDSASKLLTPSELMSMAAGAQDVKPSAERPEEEPEPAPKARPAPKAKSARPAPPPPPPGHMEALLGGLREQIYNDIAGFVAAQQAEVREERAAREAAERERQKQLLTAVSAAITRDLPVQIEKILKKELKGVAGEIGGKVVAATKERGGEKSDLDTKVLTAALPKALRDAVTSAVVPKFEKATDEMFKQVKSTFERGMDELAAELYTQKENAVAAEVGPLVHTLRGATDEVRVAAEMLAASGGAGGPEKTGEGASSLAELESRMDPTVALGALVDAGDFEGAFTKALGLSSVDTVAWVCSRADAKREAIFSSTPVALSQGVLLSLAQQLSSDLEEEPELKIAWVRDAALAIDPSDAALAQHMRPILEAVFAGLHECATAPETPAPVKNDLRLCIHVVNSLLTACK